MNWDIVAAIAETIGALAVISTLIYLSVQIKRSQETAIANAIEQTNASSIALENQLIDNADLWVRANSNEQLTESEKIIISSIMNTRVGTSARQWSRAALLRQDPKFAAVQLVRFLKQHGAAEKWWKENRREFGARDGWMESIDSKLENVD